MPKIAKNLPSEHHRTTLWGSIFATKALSTIGKKRVISNISSTCPHNMANLGQLTAEIGLPAWATPANFNGFHILPSLLQRGHLPEVNQTFYDVWPSPALVHCIFIFWGFCPLTEFCPLHNSLYVQVLSSPVLAALLHCTPAAGISQTSQHGARNRITELSQRAPPIYGWVAITLGIGPHSSCTCWGKNSRTKLAYSTSTDWQHSEMHTALF